MDSAFSYAISSSSSSSSRYSEKQVKKLGSYHSSLHGVRRLPLKPMTKQPIAPMPPTPPKIYRVEPVNFKEVVQMLTAAPEFQSVSSSESGSFNSRRLQDVAPPPLDLSPVSLQWHEFLRPSSNNNNLVESFSAVYNDSINNEAQITPRIPSENYFGSCSPLALSPVSFAWCSSILLSPTSLTSSSTVL